MAAHGQNDSAAYFGRKKWSIALWIMSAGMAAGLGWAGLMHRFHWPYPYNTLFFDRALRFNDWSDMRVIALQTNPYIDPTAFYLPAFWLVVRWTSFVPLSIQLVTLFSSGVALIYLLANRLFAWIVPVPGARAWRTLLLLLTCYPLLFCFDRGNVEIVLFALVCAAIAFASRARHGAASICLAGALCLKFTPALMLVLLVRQRRWGAAFLTVGAAVLLAWLGLILNGCPVVDSWKLYERNIQYYHFANVYENLTLEGAASPWNALKLAALTAAHCGWIQPVDFSYDNPSVRAAYAGYATGMALLTAAIALYSCVLERGFYRAVIPLLLLMSISAPSGGDYRLMYAGAALALLIATRDRRRFDLAALVLLALVMVPKKEVILEFAGRTESGYADVSLQVLLNPLFVLVALALLLAGSRKQLDLRWSRLRLVNLLRALRRPFA